MPTRGRVTRDGIIPGLTLFYFARMPCFEYPFNVDPSLQTRAKETEGWWSLNVQRDVQPPSVLREIQIKIITLRQGRLGGSVG